MSPSSALAASLFQWPSLPPAVPWGLAAAFALALVGIGLRRWLVGRPIRILVGKLGTPVSPASVFIRGLFVPANEFFSRAPEYPPVAGASLTVHKWGNIPEVYSATDVRAVNELLQLLSVSHRELAINFRSGDVTRMGWQEDGVAVGPHYKSVQILDACEPRLVAFRNPDAFRSLITQEVFQSKDAMEYGLIYKGRHPASHRTYWVIMGLNDIGTEAAAVFLRVNAKVLGRFTGSRPFAAIIGFDPGRRLDAARLRLLAPKPAWWRRLLYRRAWQSLAGTQTRSG